MRLQKQARQARGHAGAGQLRKLPAPPPGDRRPGLATLQGVGHIEYQRHIVGGGAHNAKAEHIHHQVVVAVAAAALAEQQALVAALAEFLHHVGHLRGRQKLRFLDVDHRAGLRHGPHQIGLTGQKRRQLNNVTDLGRRRRLLGGVHVGHHRHAEALFERAQYGQAVVQARAAKRMNGRAVGFVEGRLEHQGQTQARAHLHVVFRDAQGKVAALQHIDPA